VRVDEQSSEADRHVPPPVWVQARDAPRPLSWWTEDESYGWGGWLLRWYGAFLLLVAGGLGVYAVLASGNPLEAAFLLLFAPILAMLIAPAALLAWGLRRLWDRVAPARWRTGTLPAVVLSGVATVLSLLLLSLPAGWDRWLGEVSVVIDGVFLPALLLAAAIAGAVAERAVWPNQSEWWAAMVLGSLAFGAWVRLADAVV
jgi:hypothetical protein